CSSISHTHSSFRSFSYYFTTFTKIYILSLHDALPIFQELQVWIMENLRKKLSVQVLADRVAMSVRNFERVFTRELGKTPSHYVLDRKSTRLNSSHQIISYAVFCLKKKN